MKLSIILLLLLSLTSCDILKKSTKTKTDIVSTEQIQTKTTRKGDTVTYIVPRITYKDTVITTVSTQGTILKTYFDKSGQVVKSDCISSEIELLRLEMRTMLDKSVVKDKQKTEQIGVGLIPYLFGIIAFLGLAVIVALFMYFRVRK